MKLGAGFLILLTGAGLLGCAGPAEDPAPETRPGAAVYSCLKCSRRFPTGETELRGHPDDASHSHPAPCLLRVHEACGTPVYERKNWDARHRNKEDKPFADLASKCGSEIPWVGSFEEAARLARESGKPVAWWVTEVEGSPTDRKVVLDRYLQAGPFMMPGVVRLLSEQFVALRRVAAPADRDRFGLATLDFVEPGLVFLGPDLRLLHKVSGITTFSEEWIERLLAGVLRKAGRSVELEKPKWDDARRSIAEGRPDPALFEGREGPEARYFHGVALHLTGRDEEGRAEWRKIKEGRWAWKAAAELTGEGPFVRGFEVYEAVYLEAGEDLPAGTTRPRSGADVRRAVRFLLQSQRATGAWTDCNYNYGGDESLPNVHMAVTALAALALRDWGDPAQVRSAIERAERHMRDETRVAPEDADEIVWAHAFRLLYFARTGDRPMMSRLVRKLAGLQMESGIWYHEYPGSFCTALVLHALRTARTAGADVPDVLLRRGAQALSVCRSGRRVFSYHFPGKSHEIENGARRMPLCELALLPLGIATPETVASAIEDSFEYHPLLEKVRKYDESADSFKNAGYCFWFSQYGRAVAARAIRSASGLRRQREIVLSTAEVDGCWVDSPELGRTYATALALLTLKLCEE